MGEIVVHIGPSAAGGRTFRRWVEAHTELLHDHGVRPVTIVPSSQDGAGPLATAIPLDSRPFDSSRYFGMIAARADRGAGMVPRLHAALRSLADTPGAVLVSADVFGELMLWRDSHLGTLMQRLSTLHRVRLVGFLTPRPVRLERMWCTFESGNLGAPSAWLTPRSSESVEAELLRWQATWAPSAELELTPFPDGEGADLGATRHLVEQVLGLPPGSADDAIPVVEPDLPTAIVLHRAAVRNHPGRVVLQNAAAELTEAQTLGKITLAPTEPADTSRRLLVSWCAEDQSNGPDVTTIDALWGHDADDEGLDALLDEWAAFVDVAPLRPAVAEAAELLDLGCGVGAALESASKRFGIPAIGIERAHDRVREGQAAGRPVFKGDVLELDPKQFPSVKYAYFDNVLEHLHSERDVGDALSAACRIASRFVWVRHPSFDEMDYVASVGGKMFWTDWPGNHTCLLPVDRLVALGREAGAKDVIVQPVDRIWGTGHPSVLPLDAPSHQTAPYPAPLYDPLVYGPKPSVEFDRPVWAAYDVVFILGDGTVELTYPSDPETTQKRPTMTWVPASTQNDEFP